MIESPEDRAMLLADWGEASIGGVSVPGLYDAPDAQEIGISGYAPTFLSDRQTLIEAGVTVGTVIDSITNHAGTVVGPFRVAVWAPQDDGEFISLQLEATT